MRSKTNLIEFSLVMYGGIYMYVEYDDIQEEISKKKAKAILDKMNQETKQKALVAIEDAFSDDNKYEMNWEIIATALTKKSIDNFEQYGFGLFFNRNFLANVHKQIDRNMKAESLSDEDYEAFFTDDKSNEFFDAFDEDPF